MSWIVKFHEEFEKEFKRFPIEAQDAIDGRIESLEQKGPSLGPPDVKALKGSKHDKMKELRYKAAGSPWRIAFAFDSDREAILLAGGKKSGVSQKLFYKRLIARAERRYDRHIARRNKGKRQ